MRRLLLVVVLALAVALGPAAPPFAQAAEPSAVRPWIEHELDAIASHSTDPPRASRALAHVSSTMYLAALGVRHGGGGSGVDGARAPVSR